MKLFGYIRSRLKIYRQKVVPYEQIVQAVDMIEQLTKRSDMIEQLAKMSDMIERLAKMYDMLLDYQTRSIREKHKNPLNKFGNKCFSQTDEDGITLEIIRRLGIKDGVYAEFGVGNGLENNTIILASLGWRGFWVGGEELAINCSPSRRFKYIKDWITTDNIVLHAKSGMKHVGASEIDVISLDLDGNDIYFVEKLLSNGLLPKMFIVEYNAKFIPPSKFQIKYNPEHKWAGDDYFGASLTNFCELFERYSYKLVCCNAHTGANAFFVSNAYQEMFLDVPRNIADIYVPPRYYLYNNYGHRASPIVVETIINQ